MINSKVRRLEIEASWSNHPYTVIDGMAQW